MYICIAYIYICIAYIYIYMYSIYIYISTMCQPLPSRLQRFWQDPLPQWTPPPRAPTGGRRLAQQVPFRDQQRGVGQLPRHLLR